MFGLQIIQVDGHSMEPTIKSGSFVLIKKSKRYQIGDIVAFWHNHKQLLKRINGMEQDTVLVTGDNPSDSLDSKQFGAINISTITGKAIIW